MRISTLIKAKIRNYYRSLVGRLILDSSSAGQKDLFYWQNKLFAISIFYAFPICLLTLIPIAILELQDGHTHIVLFNMISLSAVAFIVFNKNISIKMRKIFIAFLILLFSVVMMAFMGSFTIGSIYMFLFSIFISLQFSNRTAYRVVGLNFLICTFFAMVLWLKPFRLPVLYQQDSLYIWLIYSVNFLFTDLMVVILIRRLLTGLDRTLLKETVLSKKLTNELHDKNLLNKQLHESEAQYRTLFFQSPLPKWIFDTESLRFLQVNDAAISGYGYTADEFLQMSLTDIHFTDQIPDFLQTAEIPPEQIPFFITSHKRKNGQEMHVEIRRSDIFFQGKKARMVIATDITEQNNRNLDIELRNRKLQEIAHIQSHIVRVPLANVIGITDLIMQLSITESEKELFRYLETSIRQLDQVVCQIISHAENVLTDKKDN